MQAEERRAGKVKKGWLAVRVDGGEAAGGGGRRFVIPISHLYHPLFRRLLEEARDTYGYDSSGPLRLPCSVDEFLRLQRLIEHQLHGGSGGSGRVHGMQPSPASLHSCYS